MVESHYDVVIVGARVAGATLAALLGDAGVRVLLLDRARFPSPTLSTHFFRGSRAVSVLDRLDLLGALLALGAPPLTCTYRYPAGEVTPQVGPPQAPGEIPYSLSVRREPLDHAVVRRAIRSASVELVEAARVASLLWDGNRVCGVRVHHGAHTHDVHARFVVGADGRHSLVARLAGAATEASEPPHRGIYYQYVYGWTAPHGGTPDGPEFARIEDEQGYVFPSDAGMTCLALSVNLAGYAWVRAAPEERFRERLRARPGLASRVAGAQPASRLFGCGPVPNYMRVPIGPGWALVGDAGLHQDPWSGNGIDCAMLHATYLAEALVEAFAGTACEEAALSRYHTRRNEQALEGFHRTVVMSRDLRQLDVVPAPVPGR